MYYNADKNIIICKTYKTASVTLYKLLKECRDESILYRDHISIKYMREFYKLRKDEVTSIVGVRNPWDMASSYYHYCIDGEEEGVKPTATFDAFIKNRKDLWARNNRWDTSEIDDVIAFEDLENEIKRIGMSYNLPCLIHTEIPHINSSSNKNYKDNYNEELKNIVFGEYEEYISFLKGKFGINYTF